MLRPRYMPDWKPSWVGIKRAKLDIYYEDAYPLQRGSTFCDATRISDGSYVILKVVKPSLHPCEAEITTFVSSKPLASDPRNHCVQLYEILTVPDDPDKILLVLPMLRPWDRPKFETVGEVVEFIRQIFEGLQFMHEHRLAHRDISLVNIMMDGVMYPDDWHPYLNDFRRDDISKIIKPYTRTQRVPRYYFIDFGISRLYKPEDGPHPLEPPIRGGDKTVPEFQDSMAPCDPFPTDIYYVGNLLREYIHKEYRNFAFLRPLVVEMVRKDPTKRPTIDEVVAWFDRIRGQLRPMQLASRAGPRDEWFGDLRDRGRRVVLAIRGVPSVRSVAAAS